MKKLKHNPIIGYHAVDRDYCVIGPPGTLLDPAFGSEDKARQAAKRYGMGKKLHLVGALHLGGVMGVIFHDVGDIQLDGESAQRLMNACQLNEIAVNPIAVQHIDPEEQEPKYSCRQILTP